MSTLYLVATPIGNLEDLSPRGQRVLREVKLIAAEDTRHSRKLLNHFDIHTPLTSYFEHNERLKLDEVLAAFEPLGLKVDGATDSSCWLGAGDADRRFGGSPRTWGRCGHSRWWRTKGTAGLPTCGVCHPPAPGLAVVWLESAS